MQVIRKNGILVLIIAVALIATAGVYFALTKNKVSNTATPTGTQADETKSVGPTTTVKIGSKEVSKGTFQKIENNAIFFMDKGEVFSLPLTEGEIAVNCTDQSLDSATVLDYTLIKKVKVYNPQTILNKIPKDEPIVLFASMVGDTLRAHTIAMKTSSCPK